MRAILSQVFLTPFVFAPSCATALETREPQQIDYNPVVQNALPLPNPIRSSGILTGLTAAGISMAAVTGNTSAAGSDFPKPMYVSYGTFVADYANQNWLREGTLLILVRHGESLYNRVDVFTGSNNNSPLTDVGRAQSRDLAMALARIPIDGIYSSPLARAWDTATILQQGLALNTPPIAEERLREMNLGIRSGRPKNMTSAEIDAFMKRFDEPEFRAQFKSKYNLSEDDLVLILNEAVQNRKVLQRKACEAGLSEDEFVARVLTCENDWNCTPPFGESFAAAAQREENLTATVLNSFLHTTTVLVGHSATQRLLMARLLGVDIHEVQSLYQISQGLACINVLWKRPGDTHWSLLVLNGGAREQSRL